MKKLIGLTLLGLLIYWPAMAQNVRQSGNVTPGHAACWAITGVVYDCGLPAGSSILGSYTANDLVAVNGSGSLIDSGISPVATSNITALWNFNGGATAPTRPLGDNSTNVATTAFAQTAASNPNNLSITVTTNVNSTLCAEAAGVRAPIYVCNDNNGTSAAGYALTFEGWVGNNPVGSIAADNAVAIFQYIDNTGGRQGTWAMNFVCNQLQVSLGGSVSQNHCQENDVLQSQAATTPLSAFNNQGPITHAYEAVCSQNTGGSPQPCQVAYWAWAAGDYANSGASQTQPFNFGFAAARVQYSGFDCETQSGDTGQYFKAGCLWDQSNSLAVVSASNSHASFISLFNNPTIGLFVYGKQNSDTNLLFANAAEHNFYMSCGAGVASEAECGWFFVGKGGTVNTQYWKFFKDTSNNIRMTNIATGHIVTQWQSNDNVVLGANSGAPTTINAAGQVSIGNSIIYGGVTLANSVTGTGSMVLSASPTFTGTVTMPDGSTWSSTLLAAGNVSVVGQLRSTFGTPTIASGACGATTNGSVAGSNQSGLITIGAAATTTCTVSFSTTITAPNACVIFPANTAAATPVTTVARVSSVGTTNFVVTGSVLANANYYFICL